MPYDKQTWADRQVQNPMTFVLTNNADGTITLTPSPGAITSEGSLLLAERMNHMEDGIALVNDRIDKELKTITDCNEALETGIYWAPNGTKNNPSENNFIIQTYFKDSENIMQLAYLASGNLNVVYKRYFTTTWSDWISNTKSAISVCFENASVLQAGNSRLIFNTVLNTNGDRFYLENGYIKTRKDVRVLVSLTVWVNTQNRVWFTVFDTRNGKTVNSIDLIGQDASGYQTLTGVGVFDFRAEDIIHVVYNQSDAVYLNQGSGRGQATLLSVVEI